MKSDLRTKKEVKKPVRKKAAPAVLAVTPTPAKKRVPKAVAAKTTPVKKVAPKPSRTVKTAVLAKESPMKPRVSATKKLARVEPEVAPDVVYLPSRASLRLLEKVELYRLWYQTKFPAEMARAARVVGYSFVVLGTLLAAGNYMANKFAGAMPAATVCSTVDCVEVSDSNLSPSAPLVTFLNSLPEVVSGDTDITVRSRTAVEPMVYLRAVQSGEQITLEPIERMKDGEFRYVIELAKLEPGFFELVAQVADQQMVYKFAGPTFSVAGFKSVAVPAAPVVVVPTDTDSASSTATTTSEAAEIEVEPEVVETIQATPAPIDLVLEADVDSRFLKIKTGTYTPESVEVYSRLAHNGSAVLLGGATRVQGEWIFSLSAIDLPSATHEIFASFSTQGRTYQTRSVAYVPSSESGTKLASDDEVELLVSKIMLALETAEVQNATRQRYYSHIASTSPAFFDTVHEETFASTDIVETTDALFDQNVSSIDALLYTYALVSGGSLRYLEEFSTDAMRRTYLALSESTLTPRESSTLETILASRFEALRGRVKEMEERMAEDAKSLTETDTDTDGLSDFDELANLGTDPAKTDTDLDSVIDSIEVISGSNPTTPDLQHFPKYDALVLATTDTPITIEAVHGVTEQVAGQPKTYPVIQGKSLPYSFVYIFVGEGASAGLIKTGADGAFSYTYEAALLDGTHEVVAALATVDGQLVAKTAPFLFTKRAERLAAAALFSERTQMLELGPSSRVPYVVAASIAVVTFGFVLILLAQSLVLRRRDTIVTH